jgi:hypothetical protein
MKRFVSKLAWLAVMLSACAKSEDPLNGSQTHFLETCDDSCPAPYDCICGVCTIECSQDAMCGAHADDAQCLAPVSASCTELESVCDVTCERDRECASLGADFACSDGRCREQPGPLPADAGTDADTPPEARGALCDGSTDMRLGYTSEGGQVETTYEFTNPYGHSFFFLDGECNFYASADYHDGLYIGPISAGEAEALERAIEWDAIDELAAEVDDEGCDDGGTVTIWAPGYQVSCTCGCDETPIGARKDTALQVLRALLDARVAESDHAATPTLAIASPTDDVPQTIAWPLDRAIDVVPSLVHDVNADGVDSFAVFDRNVDIQALRQLRVNSQLSPSIRVTDVSGAYELHMRDAFPLGVQARINALRGIERPIDPLLGELCDGSTDLRLGYSADGGFVDVSFSFTNPHGHWFLFIDGQCNYYVSTGYWKGVATGVLDAPQAEALALDVDWDSIDELRVEDVESCPDAGSDSIWAPDGRRVSCTCGCDEGPVSARKMNALDTMRELAYELAMQGQSATGPVSALASLTSPAADALAWPLGMAIADFPSLVHDLNDLGPNPEYALFEDAMDAMALRSLRAQQQPGTPLSVTDGQATYQLWVRDELPDGVSAAIESLRGVDP